jgi:uncharacterized protein (TIGR02285 family)
MRSLIARAAVVLCLAGFSTASNAQSPAREVLYWYISDFPPIYILEGPDQGKGTGDERLRILFKRTPEFDHRIVQAPTIRILEAMKTEPNVCSASFLKTPEREAFLEYSNPFPERLPNGVITLRTRLPQLKPFMDKKGVLSVEALLNHGKTRLGIIKGRSFGAGIDAVLNKHAGSSSLVVVPGSALLASRLLKLATQDEFDAVVGYAHELRYLTRQLNLNERDFVFVPVAEEPPLLSSYAACSKSEFGRRAIAAINRALSDPEALREDIAVYRQWLDDETAARYDRVMQERQRQGK